MSQKLGTAVIVVVLIAGAYFVGSAADGWNPFGESGATPYTDVGPAVVESVQSMARLTTVEMVEYTTIEKGNDHGWLNWAREDRLAMLAVARIGAGVDLEQLSPGAFAVDIDTGAVTVQLPPAQITYVALDNAATQVFGRDTGIFTSGDPQLESDARQVAEEVLRGAALEHGILEEAEENARVVITELLMGLGYTEVHFATPPQ
jgi:CubicO group peptidase (beta-lactamase class C family)